MIQRTRTLHCIQCGHELDSSEGLCDPDARITPDNSYTLCAYCGTIMVFIEKDKQLDVRAVTEEEMKSFAQEQPEDFGLLMQASMLVKVHNKPNYINPQFNSN